MADNKHRGSTLDEFLAHEGVLDEFQARAVKAWQLAEADASASLTPILEQPIAGPSTRSVERSG
jgi:hypothetical protein